jgi:hypothetical protein
MCSKLSKERIEEMDEEKIDRKFFESDEFLTLFNLMLEQIRTTHDKAKLKMLAAGLANSASSDFASEKHKELFLRILRDPSPEDVLTLTCMAHPATAAVPQGDQFVVKQRLTSQGLLSETLHVESLPAVNFAHRGAYELAKRCLERDHPAESTRCLVSAVNF